MEHYLYYIYLTVGAISATLLFLTTVYAVRSVYLEHADVEMRRDYLLMASAMNTIRSAMVAILPLLAVAAVEVKLSNTVFYVSSGLSILLCLAIVGYANSKHADLPIVSRCILTSFIIPVAIFGYLTISSLKGL